MKRVTFGGKPTAVAPGRPSAEEWVSDREPAGPTKRLTVDVPLALHRRFKTRCAAEGLNMADVVRELLERRFPPPGAGGSLGDVETVEGGAREGGSS